MTVLSEAIFIAHKLPELVQTVLAASVFNAVIMFMVMH